MNNRENYLKIYSSFGVFSFFLQFFFFFQTTKFWVLTASAGSQLIYFYTMLYNIGIYFLEKYCKSEFMDKYGQILASFS